jgi:DsbE subfamily thiol:disulfide oxidoreductase
MKKTVLVFVSILAIAFLLISCKGKQEKASAVESGKIYAKNFSLPSLDGNEKIDLKDFKGEPIVINFWASWCGPCREEMPFLQKTWNEYKDKGIVFLGINVLDEEKNAKDFLNSFGISYINLKDSNGETANSYSVVALPATFFIDKQGKIVRRNYGAFVGSTNEKSFINSIEEIDK